MDKSPELLKLQEGINLDCKTESMLSRVQDFEQKIKEARHQGYINGSTDTIERYRFIMIGFQAQIEEMKRFIEITERQAKYITENLNDSASDTKLINALLDFISCVACPVDNCNVISVSPQCREVLREYFEGRVKG